MIETALSNAWMNELGREIQDLRLWLSDPANIDDTLEDIADMLVEKHHDYGEENLTTFGELGVLVRATDKVSRLKTLVEKQGQVKDESREDTWKDLAGYAVQALIMMNRAKTTWNADVFETRRRRLIRGLCPDCGRGVILRQRSIDLTTARLYCSLGCGFETQISIFDMEQEMSETIRRLAGVSAVKAQQ